MTIQKTANIMQVTDGGMTRMYACLITRYMFVSLQCTLIFILQRH